MGRLPKFWVPGHSSYQKQLVNTKTREFNGIEDENESGRHGGPGQREVEGHHVRQRGTPRVSLRGDPRRYRRPKPE